MIDYMDPRYDRLHDLGYSDEEMARLSSRSADEILFGGVPPQHWDRWEDDDRLIEIPAPRRATPQANGHTAEAPSSSTAGIPFVITANTKARLREIGYTDDEIFNMRPEDAQQILKAATAIEPRPSPPTQPNQEPSQPEQAQAHDDVTASGYQARPFSGENYNLDELSTELRSELNRVTATVIAAKRNSAKVLRAIRAGAAALVEFDLDPGYEIAIAHLQAMARDYYTLSDDDIQTQISNGIQDALDQRARDQGKRSGKQHRQRERNVEPLPVEPEDHGLATSEDAVWSSEDALALQLAGQYLDDLRFVAPWSRWLRYSNDDGRWRTDERLETFDDARKICRATALEA
jgi:hypothetical protein